MVDGEFIARRVYDFFRSAGYRDSVSHGANKLFIAGTAFTFKVDGKSLDILIGPSTDNEGFGRMLLEANTDRFYQGYERLREKQRPHRKTLPVHSFEVDEDGSYHFRAKFDSDGRDSTFPDRLSLGVLQYAVRPTMLVERKIRSPDSE